MGKKIIPFVVENIPVRRSFTQELIDHGFDATIEAQRLLAYYKNVLKK